MASNGGPEEDPAVGVWKSLLEWECRAWGSAQRSAPETATGPSMPCAPKTLKVTRQHKFTSRDLPHTHSHTHTKKKKAVQVTQRDTLWLWSVGESRAAKKGSLPENVPKCVAFVEGEFNVLSSRVLCDEPSCILKRRKSEARINLKCGIKKKPRRRPKQKAGEKCSVSRRLQTAPGV